MIKIAHRGNTQGISEKENSPQHLMHAILLGLDVEADVWLIDDELFLGHDGPEYKMPKLFLEELSQRFWFHCKNLEALSYFSLNLKHLKYFWHESDRYTMVSNGVIWAYPGQDVSSNCIMVDLGNGREHGDVLGICSDFWPV